MVTALITGHGDKRLVDITVDGQTITATDGHPFWVENRRRWVRAADLVAGDVLLDATGRARNVQQVKIRNLADQTVHNLTVDGLHTYFVLAGNTPLLTHNSSSCDTSGADGPRNAPNTAGGGGRVFTHFTDEAGAAGITGTRPLAVGQSAEVGQLTFAKGNNQFLVGEGRIGVTDLGLDATPGQLNGIGVFGPRQQYGIQFSELDAWNSGVRVMGDLPSRNIYSIPGGCTITGTCTVTRAR